MEFDITSLKNKRIVFISAKSEKELKEGFSGSEKIQYILVTELRKHNFVKVVKITEFSYSLPKLFNLINTVKNKIKIKNKESNNILFNILSKSLANIVDKYRWLLITITWILQYYSLSPPFLNKKKMYFLNNYDVVFFGGELLGIPYFKRFIKSKKIITLTHNVGWIQVYELIEKIPIVWKIIFYIFKKINIECIVYSDEVICLSPHDAKILKKYTNKPEKIKYIKLLNIIKQLSKKEINELKNKAKKLKIYNNIKNKFIIGFVGANYKPNIIAVEHLLKLARKVSPDTCFLIIGSINEAFIGRKDLPSNVIFTGYVEDLDVYLALCDAFINIKTISDTGLEIKMLDYLKFDKPVISTKMGARGFENLKNVIIVKDNDIDKIAKIIENLKNIKFRK